MHTESLPTTPQIFENLFSDKGNEIDWHAASEYLDAPIKTIEGWHSRGEFPAMAVRILQNNWNLFWNRFK